MPSSASKILSLPTLIATLVEWRAKGNKIVFTNGCFDILHFGHVDYLERAKGLGDRLVLGLNTDSSVSRIKGPERPLQSEESRARVVAALGCVDAVVLFDQETPLELIKAIRPDVLVKGADYTEEQVVGAVEVKEYGGQVSLIPFVEGFSTSSIVQKMRNKP